MHFALTIVYVMPVTPIKLEHKKLLDATVGKFFYQDWRLFAPNPIANNAELIVKCGSADWMNITKPLLENLQNNRLTPAGRVERVHGGAIRLFLNTTSGAETWQKACQRGDKTACKKYKKLSNEFSERGKKMLVRIGSVYCKIANETAQEVSLRIRHNKHIKWSERYTAKRGAFDDIEVGTFPLH